jgi:hypothetical protein
MSDYIPKISNIHTSAFVLSMLSNLGSGESDPLARLIRDLIKAINNKLEDFTFKLFFGDWNIKLAP